MTECEQCKEYLAWLKSGRDYAKLQKKKIKELKAEIAELNYEIHRLKKINMVQL